MKITLQSNTRPIRLWNSQLKDFVVYRYFKLEGRAHDAAMRELRWNLEIGDSLEVVDTTHAKHLGTYTRRIGAIMFLGPNDRIERRASKSHVA